MPAASNTLSEYTLRFSEGEHTLLLNLLQQALRNTHVEARRTENPTYQDAVHHQESLLRGLIEKMRQPRS